ncbi:MULTISPECIES: GNAT family N-acetyltransferase [unclassified Microbacterium]|uniref:GNAT family N-acetyltransferase n=1 Tax=unclassified Microbacterium TaxID=2609290 RepID=UPI0012FA8D01|nr:GNAT family N-acetyltransferase [Microbacterium sp. MAH-37]MVQ41622.1 GNAT family N-acetyltransferase [Microbacterium sp. MAH-37]
MPDERLTDRLILRRPTDADIDPVHEIFSDPRVWEHFPSLRHVERSTTAHMLTRWQERWDEVELASWIVRLRETGEVIGTGGCTLLAGASSDADVWNLGYRISADHHRRGYATEVSRAGIAAARNLRPETPIIAFLVEHNTASAAVAEKVGLSLVHRAPDAGNPDPAVMRLIYADRPLTDAQRETALR